MVNAVDTLAVAGNGAAPLPSKLETCAPTASIPHAFGAVSAVVDHFFQAVIENGDTANGEPDVREYYSQCYAAFVLELEGSFFEAKFFWCADRVQHAEFPGRYASPVRYPRLFVASIPILHVIFSPLQQRFFIGV